MTTDLPVHVLSVYQPWAWAIVHGHKPYENRDWKPTHQCRLLIHAGLTIDTDAYELLTHLGIRVPAPNLLRHGQIIGRVDNLDWEWSADHPLAERGKWNWCLTNPARARPAIPYRGKPGLPPAPDGWQESFRHTERKTR